MHFCFVMMNIIVLKITLNIIIFSQDISKNLIEGPVITIDSNTLDRIWS